MRASVLFITNRLTEEAENTLKGPMKLTGIIDGARIIISAINVIM